MGRVKSVAVKSLGNDLMQRYGGRFTVDFGKNKKVLGEVIPIQSKKIRNVLAGYLVRRVQQMQAAKEAERADGTPADTAEKKPQKG